MIKKLTKTGGFKIKVKLFPFIVLIWLIYLTVRENKVEQELQQDKIEVVYKIPDFIFQDPDEGLLDALEYYGVHHTDIVYAQALLESGNFNSKLCTEGNNLFGLYDSKNNDYYRFKHWSESVLAYRDYIQYRYKDKEDYYQFLKRIGYAEDSLYIDKVKRIVKRNDKRGITSRDIKYQKQ